MHRAILVVVAVLALAIGAGCTFVTSAQGGNTGKTNEAWYVESVGFGGLVFATHVYYCPPLGGGGAATCQEAEIIDNAQPAAPGAPPPPPPPSAPPPPPAGDAAPPPAE